MFQAKKYERIDRTVMLSPSSQQLIDELMKTVKLNDLLLYQQQMEISTQQQAQTRQTRKPGSDNSQHSQQIVEELYQHAVRHNIYTNEFSPQLPPITVARATLPTYAHWKEIIDVIDKNQVVVISGNTG